MSFNEIRQVMRQAAMARWEHLRRLGRARYIVIYGILAWGVPVWALFTLMRYLSRDRFPPLNEILLLGLGWLLLGFLTGYQQWRGFEKQYRKRADDVAPTKT